MHQKHDEHLQNMFQDTLPPNKSGWTYLSRRGRALGFVTLVQIHHLLSVTKLPAALDRAPEASAPTLQHLQLIFRLVNVCALVCQCFLSFGKSCCFQDLLL